MLEQMNKQMDEQAKNTTPLWTRSGDCSAWTTSISKKAVKMVRTLSTL